MNLLGASGDKQKKRLSPDSDSQSFPKIPSTRYHGNKAEEEDSYT
jgi:hypothetical protein